MKNASHARLPQPLFLIPTTLHLGQKTGEYWTGLTAATRMGKDYLLKRHDIAFEELQK